MRVARGRSDENAMSVSVSGTSAKTANPIGKTSALIYSTVECFVLAGDDPTATAALGTPIPANALVRLGGIDASEKLAFIAASGTGTAYVRPGA